MGLYLTQMLFSAKGGKCGSSKIEVQPLILCDQRLWDYVKYTYSFVRGYVLGVHDCTWLCTWQVYGYVLASPWHRL